MNIIIKKKKLENPGIDPGASRIQIERSTTLTNPRFALNLTNPRELQLAIETNITLYWPIFSLFPRELQLAMNIIIKKQELENSVSIPVTLEYKSIALPLELIPLCIDSIDQSFPYFLVSCN